MSKNPEFPGSSFWHFKRTRETYRRFVGELLIYEPLLINLQKIGHDLDKGLAEGMNFCLTLFYLLGGLRKFQKNPPKIRTLLKKSSPNSHFKKRSAV